MRSTTFILIVVALFVFSLTILYSSQQYSLRRLKLIQYYEKEMKFKDLLNPRFSERKYRHYYGKPNPGEQESKQFEEGPFTADAWKDYKHYCGKNWNSKEEQKQRYELWLQRYKEKEEINQKNSKFTIAQSCSMDLTDEEINNKLLGESDTNTTNTQEKIYQSKKKVKIHTSELPEYVSWKNIIQAPIREQQCSDCWANAGVEALESLYQIIGYKYTQFSVQEQINCAKVDWQGHHEDGCQGGWKGSCFEYAQYNGAVPEVDQPYKGEFQSGDQCTNDYRYPVDNKFFVSELGWAENCDELKAALTKQPVSVSIFATNSFLYLTSSIYPFETASSTNHAVLLVGYTPNYWIIQNSWGNLAHYNGYARLAMGNTLNICAKGIYPISTATYQLQPSTNVINFENDFGNNPTSTPSTPSGTSGENTGGTSGSTGGTSGSTPLVVEGINLNYMIGTKFYIFTETYDPSQSYYNKKGEGFVYLSFSYWYVPEGRLKTDFNYQQLSITFVNESENSFEFIFEPKDGYLEAINIDGFKMGQCSIQGKTGGFLYDICSNYSTNLEKRFFIIGPNYPYIGLYWYKP